MDITATQNVSKLGHLMQSRPWAAPTAEQHTHTKTHASSAYKNTQKKSTVHTVAMLKFTQNAQQPSQLYSHS